MSIDKVRELLSTEEMRIPGFGEWAEATLPVEDRVETSVVHGSLHIEDRDLLEEFLAGIFPESATEVLGEIAENKVFVETMGTYFLRVKCSAGSIRIPRALVSVGGSGNDA